MLLAAAATAAAALFILFHRFFPLDFNFHQNRKLVLNLRGLPHQAFADKLFLRSRVGA